MGSFWFDVYKRKICKSPSTIFTSSQCFSLCYWNTLAVVNLDAFVHYVVRVMLKNLDRLTDRPNCLIDAKRIFFNLMFVALPRAPSVGLIIVVCEKIKISDFKYLQASQLFWGKAHFVLILEKSGCIYWYHPSSVHEKKYWWRLYSFSLRWNFPEVYYPPYQDLCPITISCYRYKNSMKRYFLYHTHAYWMFPLYILESLPSSSTVFYLN